MARLRLHENGEVFAGLQAVRNRRAEAPLKRVEIHQDFGDPRNLF